MEQEGSSEPDDLGEDYRGWPLQAKLELLAFDARLAGVPQALTAVVSSLPVWRRHLTIGASSKLLTGGSDPVLF
jgi:hypothetical protein